MKVKNVLLILSASLVAFLPQLSSACVVCFGGADSNLRRGFTWGVLILVTLPFLLAGGLSGLIAYNIRKNKRHV